MSESTIETTDDRWAAAAEEVVDTVDEWLSEYTSAFDPLAWTETDEMEYRRKAFSELALYVYVTDEYDPEPPAELPALVERCGDTEAYASLLWRTPSDLLRYGPAITYLIHRDVGDSSAPDAVEWALSHSAVRGNERLPNRELDVARLSAMAGVEPQIDVGATTDRSMLATTPDIVRCSRMDAYALTHDVLFCTDFGVERYTLGDVSDYDIGTELDGLLLRFAATGHTDLTLELLLCGVTTGQLSPVLVTWTLDWIRDRTADHGHVPGPDSVVAPPTLSGTRSDDEETDPAKIDLPSEWLEDYHTNLVAGITGRLVAHEGDRVGEPKQDRDEWDAAALVHLGAALDAFADYELKEGADHLVALDDARLPSDLLPVVERAGDFLEEQARDDGTFGYWTDERRTFEQLGHDVAAFEVGPLRRTTAACRAALDTVESLTDRVE